jgi:hypothetical protein
MANWKTSPSGNNDYPNVDPSLNKIVDEDPMIVRVPLADMGWSSTKSIMAKVRGENQNGRLDIKHVEGKKGP